jgi:OmpR family response regulator RpaB
MDQQPRQLKVVIVEDNVSLAEIYKTRLEILGYKCIVAVDGAQALEVIEKELPDLVLLDLMVPKIAGDQILERMRASDWGKNIKVQVISNLNEVDAPAGLREHGIEGYAVKANLTDDMLDKLVDDILKPEDQEEDVSLETSDK